jgi:hypothetical protein
MKIKNIKDIASKLEMLENKYNLFSILILKKIPFWMFIRPTIFEAILSDEGLSEGVSPNRNIGIKKILLTMYAGISGLFSLIKKNKADYLFFETPRRFEGGEPYLSPLYENIDPKKYIRFCYTEKWTYRDDNVVYLNLLKLIGLFVSILLSPLAIFFLPRKEFSNFKSALKELLPKNGSQFFYKMKYFECIYWYFIFIFILRVSTPKKVFIVSNTFFIPLIAACDKYDIETIEVQHGVISKYAPNYNVSSLHRRYFFPRKILLMGDGWKFINSFLPRGVSTKVLGSVFFKNKSVKKNREYVLFISQKNLRGYFLDFIKNNVNILNNYKIIYKLHPMEFGESDQIISMIPESISNNIKFIQDEVEIHTLLDKAIFQIGSYSTALLEGVQLKIPTLLIKTPLYYHLDFLVDKGVVLYSENSRDFEDFIISFENSIVNNKSDFFQQIDIGVINEVVSL